MIIREITSKDIDEVVCLLNSLMENFPPDKQQQMHNVDTIKNELGRPKEFRPTYLVAEEDGKIVGAASISFITETCLIKEIAVNKSERRRGVGSALIKKIEEIAAANGCGKVWAYSAVLYGAKGFYNKKGYVEEGLLKKHFYSQDHYIFSKVL